MKNFCKQLRDKSDDNFSERQISNILGEEKLKQATIDGSKPHVFT